MTHSIFGSNHSLEAWILLELRREWLSSRNLVGKLFQINGVSNLVREGRIPFYRHSSKIVVMMTSLDMSGSRLGHVRNSLLESSHGTGLVWYSRLSG
jgi:hypothetical protein